MPKKDAIALGINRNNTTGENETASQVLCKGFTTDLKVQAIFFKVQTCNAPQTRYETDTSHTSIKKGEKTDNEILHLAVLSDGSIVYK